MTTTSLLETSQSVSQPCIFIHSFLAVVSALLCTINSYWYMKYYILKLASGQVKTEQTLKRLAILKLFSGLNSVKQI